MDTSYSYDTTTTAPLSTGGALLILGVFVLLIAVAIGTSYWCGRSARNRGYSFGRFFALSLFFGIPVWIIVACLPRKDQAPPQYSADGMFVKNV